MAFTATTSEQKWPSSSLQCGQFGWNAAFSQPFIAVDGSAVTSDFSESKARKTPSRPSGARLATHADCRGDQITSPTDIQKTQKMAAFGEGSYASHRGESAWHHKPGSITEKAS